MRKVKLDIGCGGNKKSGYIGLDINDGPEVDVIIDINKGIPYKKDSVDEIFTSHFLEHVNNPEFILNEFGRVLKRGGTVKIIVPHYSNPYSYHFTHKTYWSSFSLDQKFLDYYLNSDLVLVSKTIHIRFLGFIDPLLTVLANISQSTYERFFCSFLHAWEIEFILVKSPRIRNKTKLVNDLH
jgi:SAM-dependent methyltransferase